MLEEGLSYSLGEGKEKGNYNYSKIYQISAFDSGQLTITKNDPIQGILSGRFWFDAADKETGEKVEIREGRFDIVY